MILAKNGLTWFLEKNQKLAVSHVLSAVKPQTLKDRLESDLEFSHHQLKKDFKSFLDHSLKLSDAFQLLDPGNQRKVKTPHVPHPNRTRSGNHTPESPGNSSSQSNVPLCLWPPHRARGLHHLLRNCRECPPDVKRELLAKRASQLPNDGPSYNTRSKKPSSTTCLLYTSPSPRDQRGSRMPSSA